MSLSRKILGSLSVISLLNLPAIGVATEGEGFGTTQTGYEAVGVRVGSFILFPEISASMTRDDNVFTVNDGEDSDTIIHIKPSLSVNSNWGRHGANIYLDTDIAKHQDFDNEDWNDVAFDASGWLDVQSSGKLSGQVRLNRLHEDRYSPNNVFGLEPVDFNLNAMSLGYEHKFNRLTASILYQRSDYNFDDVNALDSFGSVSVVDSDDRDRAEDLVTLKLMYEVNPGMSGFVSGTTRMVEYDDNLDSAGLQRSSDGYFINTGVSLELTHLLVGDVYIGYHNQDYDDPTLSSINHFNVGADLTWRPTGLTIVQGKVDGEVVDSIVDGVSGFFRTSYAVQVDHELKRNILLLGKLRYAQDDFEGTSVGSNQERDDDTVEFGLGMKYLFNRHLYLSGDYNYTKRSSNADIADYDQNILQISVGAKL